MQGETAIWVSLRMIVQLTGSHVVSQETPLGEKTRTCPSCRMMISVLATKCRHCGESVGKPKEEARKLSINDLGGENIQHRALSSSVMEALESFRIEDAKEGDDLISGFDELNIGGVSSSGGGDSQYNRSPLASSSTMPAASSGSSGMNLGLIAKIAAVIVVIGAGAVLAPKFFAKNVETESNAKATGEYVNRAPSILASTGDSLQALQAAVDAIKEAPGPQNNRIADDMLTKVIEDINSQLNASPWSKDNLKEASRLASSATQLLPGNRSKEIKEVVDAEQDAYRLNLARIDTRAQKAVFQVTPGGEMIEVARGEMIAGRFKLLSFSADSSATLEDTQRGSRRLEWRVGLGVK